MMKRILVLFAAAMLFAGSATAAPIVYKGPQGGGQQGSMQQVSNKTNVQGSQLINNGENNTMAVGTIDNKGQMKQVSNQTDIKNSMIINNGKNNEMRVGSITNQ